LSRLLRSLFSVSNVRNIFASWDNVVIDLGGRFDFVKSLGMKLNLTFRTAKRSKPPDRLLDYILYPWLS
jgi:hypothetical protein